MGVEMGAKNAVFFVDIITKKCLGLIGISKTYYEPIYHDEAASYSIKFNYNLSGIVPVVACSHTVDNVKPVTQVSGLEIQQCLICTCTNGRFSDLKFATDILKGKKINPKVRLLIQPALKDILWTLKISGSSI